MPERSIVPGMWSGITPSYFGYQECEKGHSFGPAVRDCYLLHYIFRGTGTLYKNDAAFSVGPGEIFVILPNEVTTYISSAEDPWHYGWIAFQSEKPLHFLRRPVISAPALRGLFAQIRDCAREEQTDCRVFALMYELLWTLSQQEQGREDRKTNYAAYAKAHLENKYMSPVSIEGIAQSMHIDRRHLTAVFRKAYGCTPQQYLMELRLDRAKDFLQKGFSVTESAAMAGFSDLANFSRKFKQYYGVSPRKMIQTAEKTLK